MAGPTDISTILSQAGRIEKINQNPFVQSEVARQILTEEEARARMQKNREVTEAKKSQEISISEKAKEQQKRQAKEKDQEAAPENQQESSEEESSKTEKHLIDVVV
jgi:hypothetical protein